MVDEEMEQISCELHRATLKTINQVEGPLFADTFVFSSSSFALYNFLVTCANLQFGGRCTLIVFSPEIECAQQRYASCASPSWLAQHAFYWKHENAIVDKISHHSLRGLIVIVVSAIPCRLSRTVQRQQLKQLWPPAK